MTAFAGPVTSDTFAGHLMPKPTASGREALSKAFHSPRRADLQIDHRHRVPCGAHRRRHALEAERLETQGELGVHQRVGMDEHSPHRIRRRLAGLAPGRRDGPPAAQVPNARCA
ncbi:MAG: hypothetical protein M0014_09265 [Actinomycetota bacterium]|nr:hypothetical protein [Actinomycetota bacterium]